MQNRFNKPRVFLSHAWENKPFIERIADDLRRCQIDYWLDREEIRDGRPWLKMIFEDGIPTCDAVLVYFTRESLQSKMVERELDAAVVHQLSEGGVTLLPYVSDASIRGQLRIDLQALQCREWNSNNYQSILPTVIAEIWRSYLERTVEAAVLQEKSRRLEQELENKRLTEQFESSVFSSREDQEFLYLQKKLSRQIEVTFDLFKDYRDYSLRRKVGTEVCRVSILRILLALMDNGAVTLNTNYFRRYLARAIGETLLLEGQEVTRAHFGRAIDSEVSTPIQIELQTYGLTKIGKGDRGRIVYEFSDKMYRFKYWLEYRDLLKDEPLDHVISLSLEEPQISEQPTDESRVTAEALAADKKIRQARFRKEWSTSGEGTLEVRNSFQTIFDGLKQRVIKSNEVFENITLDFHSDSNSFSITTGDVTLVLEGNCPTSNTHDCGMRVSVTTRKPKAGSESLASPRQVFFSLFTVKVDSDLKLIWTRRDGESWSTPQLAEFCWSTFITLIQQIEEEPV